MTAIGISKHKTEEQQGNGTIWRSNSLLKPGKSKMRGMLLRRNWQIYQERKREGEGEAKESWKSKRKKTEGARRSKKTRGKNSKRENELVIESDS